MRKLWLITAAAAAFLIIIILATPLLMGLWVQKNYANVLSQLNTPHLSFGLVNYKRGWFQSQAQLQVTFHSAEITLSGDSVPLAKFTISQRILHGPIVRYQNFKGAWHLEFARAALQNESRTSNLNFTASVLWSLANHLNTDLDIRHILLGNDRQRVEINNLAGNIRFSPGSRHFRSKITLESGSVYANNPDKVGNNIIDLVKVMELNQLTAWLNIRKINSLWYGNRHFEAGKVIIFPYGGNPVTAENLAADLNQHQHDSMTDFSLANHIGILNDGRFKISDLQIALLLKDMNTPILEHFAQVFMYGSDFQRLKLYPLLVDLFAKGMTVDLKQLQFNTDDGKVGLQAMIHSPLTTPENYSFLHLMENLTIQATANVPKVWLKKNLVAYYENQKFENPGLPLDPEAIAQQYLDHWQNHHLLVSQEGQVSMILNYKSGQLWVNGEKPVLDNLIINNFPGKLP